MGISEMAIVYALLLQLLFEIVLTSYVADNSTCTMYIFSVVGLFASTNWPPMKNSNRMLSSTMSSSLYQSTNGYFSCALYVVLPSRYESTYSSPHMSAHI